MTKCKEPQARKQIKTLFLNDPKQYQLFPVLSCYFKYLFQKNPPRFFRLHNCRLRAELELGIHISLASVEGGGGAQLTNDKVMDITKTEPALRNTAHFYNHICLPCFHVLSKEDPLTVCALFCFVFHIDHIVS